jgi:hypothetical protein
MEEGIEFLPDLIRGVGETTRKLKKLDMGSNL